eukprot:TRINITY_DN3024_c1_g2_i1.p1 TRINITY_DN3024_c1_g2~~TRINITY_DN3024_c1_g2_i1.p1  ORF type:complete len:526 (+),score=128.83 TRINITY_DN3024_c1_g2_i1:933-2510(+)
MAVEDIEQNQEQNDQKPAPSSASASSEDNNNTNNNNDNSNDDDDLIDVVAAKDLSWGLQAIVGESKMFPDEEDGISPALSPVNGASQDPKPLPDTVADDHSKKTGLYRPKCIITNTVDDPAEPAEEKLWSPTIAHMILQGCGKDKPEGKTVKEVMTDAFRCMVDGTPSATTKEQQHSNNEPRLWDRFNRRHDQNSNPHAAAYNHQYAVHSYQGAYPAHDYYPAQYPMNAPVYQNYNGYKKEPCKYFAMGGRCRKPDCLYYHDTQALNNTLQAVYEDEMKKQTLLEMEYENSAAILFQHDNEERRKDIDNNVSSADRTVYIVGIDSSTLDEHVLVRLSQFGSVRKYQLCGDPNQPTRYGFFEYNTLSGCTGCMTLDGKKMFTRPIRVSRAKDAIKGGRSIAEVHQQGLLRMAAVCIVQGIEAPCAKGTNLCAPPPIASKIVKYSVGYEGNQNQYVVPQEPVAESASRKKIASVAASITVPEKNVEKDAKDEEESVSPSMWTKRKAPTPTPTPTPTPAAETETSAAT